MPDETPTSNSLIQTIIRVVERNISDGSGYDQLITILSLLSLISILNRHQTLPAQAAPVASSSSGNPLHKLIGELSKGEGGPGPETLMSLLPLLNNPQIKSKINPTNIASILGLLNSFGGMGSNDKTNSSKNEKAEKQDKTAEMKAAKENEPSPPAAALTNTPVEPETLNDNNEPDQKGLGRYLNWKQHF